MKIKIPSKTFLWGEYVSLVGGSAGVLTTGPYFELLVDFLGQKTTEKNYKFVNNKSFTDFCVLSQPAKNDFTSYFHPDSPAGLILKDLSLDSNPIQELSFYDPYNLKGGFGRSTAEYIVASFLKHYLEHGIEDNNKDDHLSPIDLWNQYRSLFTNHQNKPSGYDLLAQAINFIEDGKELNNSKSVQNHLSLIEIKKDLPIIKNSSWDLKLNVLLFKTRIKINTHEHLKSLSLKDLEDLKILSQNVSQDFLVKNSENFIKNLKIFDLAIKNLNYKNLESLKICDDIMNLKGRVSKEHLWSDQIYARGCGALGADVIAVFYHGRDSESLISRIQSLSDLIFIADVHGID